jgi:hypothetical protein
MEIALLKAETVKLEKEISEIKKTKSVVLQSVSTTFSDPQSMVLETRIQQTRLSPPIRHRNHGVHICLGAGIAYNLFIINIYYKTKMDTTMDMTWVLALLVTIAFFLMVLFVDMAWKNCSKHIYEQKSYISIIHFYLPY